MKGRIGPQSFSHSGIPSEVVGLNGSGRYGFEFKIPHGKNATRRLRLDVQPDVILRIADMMRRCGPETAPGHVLWHLERPDVAVPCEQCERPVALAVDSVDCRCAGPNFDEDTPCPVAGHMDHKYLAAKSGDQPKR